MMSAAKCLAIIAAFLIAFTGGAKVSEAASPSASSLGDAFEQPYREIGYASIEEARLACERYFGKPLRLPRLQPSASFTHRLGRCSTASELNARLEVEYLHQNKGGNHFVIDVIPISRKLANVPNQRDLIRTVRLKDGSMAAYGAVGPLPEMKSFNLLVFCKGNWQYMLGVDRRIANQITFEKLVEMANSF